MVSQGGGIGVPEAVQVGSPGGFQGWARGPRGPMGQWGPIDPPGGPQVALGDPLAPPEEPWPQIKNKM